MEMNQKSNEVPEEIIQQIQSYMSRRDAARTTLLSSSWHRAWLTRPNLEFDEVELGIGIVEFGELTKKTMQRYKDLNLNINTFKLRMQRYYNGHSLPAELISKAIKLGASDLEILIPATVPSAVDRRFVLPDEVLQSKTLTRLSVSGCSIDLKKEVIITFPNLKSLNLSSLMVKGDLFGDLILRCPSIEELTLPMVDSVTSFGKLPFCDVTELVQLHKLKYLRLEGLKLGGALFRSNLCPKFACLKELVIQDFFHDYEHKYLRICSTSLECVRIRIFKFTRLRVEFDVPNIKVFEYEGDHLPRLQASSREWEADVVIRFSLFGSVSASWFSSLNQLANMLGQSRLSLSISLCGWQHYGDRYVGDGLAAPALENLTINGYDAICLTFLEGLFWSCLPNFVSIQRQCLLNVEVFQQLRSLPRKPLLDASRTCAEFFCFQLKY